MTDYFKSIPLFDILKTEDLRNAGEYFKVEKLNAEEIILNAGRRCRCLYFIVNGIKKPSSQRFFAAGFMISGIALAFALHITYSVLLLLLVMFTIKLILAFAVRWR